MIIKFNEMKKAKSLLFVSVVAGVFILFTGLYMAKQERSFSSPADDSPELVAADNRSNIAMRPVPADDSSELVAADNKAVIVCRQSKRFPDITMVRIIVPTLPDFQCDIWCYEDELGSGECYPQPDGSMILKHHHPKGAEVETQIVPGEGVVDWYVTVTGPTREAVQSVEFVNPCWQFRHAPAFRSLKGQYVESFANNCFMYTGHGFTLFKDTERFPDTRKTDDDFRNNPPWVQSYYPVWREWDGQQLEAGWGISTDRPLYSIIGVTSRDRQSLAAWGGEKSNRLSQGWHDCIHLRPLMINYDEATNTTVSHSRLYFMGFDSERLLERYKSDFPPGRFPGAQVTH